MTPTDRLVWRTSSYSSNGENCVELAPTPAAVYLRHSKHPDAGTIAFTHPAWAAFVSEARNGQQSTNGVAAIARNGADTVVTSHDEDVELRFDDEEWSAFLSGAEDGEFDFADTGLVTTG